MSSLLFIWVLLVGIAGLAVPLVDRSGERFVGRWVVLAAWLGVIGGLVGMSAGLLQTPLAAFSIVGLAAFLGFPVFSKVMNKDRAGGGGLLWISALLGLAMAGVGWAISGLELGASVVGWAVFTAQWSAVMAAVAAGIVASFATGFASNVKEKVGEGRAFGGGFSLAFSLVVAALVGGVAVIANLRANVPGQGYSLELSGDAGHVFWTVAGSAVGEKVMLQATSEVGWANGALLGLAVLVVLLGVVAAVRARLKVSEKQVAVGGIVLGLGILGTLVSLLETAGRVVLPSAQPYLNFSRQLYGAQGMSDSVASSVANRAAFVMEGAAVVHWIDLLPEILGLGLAGALCLLAGIRVFLAKKTSQSDDLSLIARDLSLQAVSFGWLAWVLGQFMRWNLYGSIGLAGAGEWVSLGVLLLASGLLMFGWRPDGNRLDRVLSGVAPGIIAALLIFGVAISYVFETSFGQ